MSVEEDRLRAVTGHIGDVKAALAALTAEQHQLIRALHAQGRSLRDIAPLAGLSHVTVGEIVKGKPELLTRTQMAARRDVHISTLMSWMTRYADFPPAADTASTDHRWDWAEVEAFLDAKGLPKMRRAGVQEEGREREERILAALRLYPGGLTSQQIADLTGAEEPAVRGHGAPTDHGILVRVEDRCRRMETAGKITRSYKPGLSRRSIITWKIAPEGTP